MPWSHRGPDASGIHLSPDGRIGLSHRRLSILDLTETGSQPMSSADGSMVLSFNGEVYNFREIREELETKGHRFRGGSDTEVMLAACREWGVREAVPPVHRDVRLRPVGRTLRDDAPCPRPAGDQAAVPRPGPGAAAVRLRAQGAHGLPLLLPRGRPGGAPVLPRVPVRPGPPLDLPRRAEGSPRPHRHDRRGRDRNGPAPTGTCSTIGGAEDPLRARRGSTSRSCPPCSPPPSGTG